MMKRTLRTIVLAALLAACLPPGAAAQAPPPEPGADRVGEGPRELRKAMRQYFEKRLRSDLSLTDEQVEEILPRVEQLEEVRAGVRREKMEAIKNLRRGMKQGASDQELQTELDRLAAAEWGQQGKVRSLMGEIDDVLSTRQRVQFRFFLERFRREMMERVWEVRGDRGDRGQGRRRPPRGGRP